MKKNFRLILLFILIIPCCLLFAGCQFSEAKYVVGISKSHSEGLVDYYNINYSDGTNAAFSITNGSDGKDGVDGVDGDVLTLETIYSIVQDEFGGNIYDFIESYMQLNVTPPSDVSYGSSKALLSTVSVYCEFPTAVMQPIYYSNGWFAGYQKVNETACSAGAGVIVDMDDIGNAYIVTNYHVIYNADSLIANGMPKTIAVYLYGQETFSGYVYDTNGQILKDDNGFELLNYGKYVINAEFIGGSSSNDIAVLKVSNSNVLKNSQALKTNVNDSDYVSAGKTVIAVGNPESLGISVTTGIISVESEYIQMSSVTNEKQVQSFRVMRTDCAVNSGNSGGGLYDTNGDLLGIVNAKINDGYTESIAYAIPANVAINIANNIIYNHETTGDGKCLKPTLGVTVTAKETTTEYDYETLSVFIKEKVVIGEIAENSLAAASDLEVGDVVKKAKLTGTIYGEQDIKEKDITRIFQVSDMLNMAIEDAVITLYVQRVGVDGLVEINITLTAENFRQII